MTRACTRRWARGAITWSTNTSITLPVLSGATSSSSASGNMTRRSRSSALSGCRARRCRSRQARSTLTAAGWTNRTPWVAPTPVSPGPYLALSVDESMNAQDLQQYLLKVVEQTRALDIRHYEWREHNSLERELLPPVIESLSGGSDVFPHML